MTPAAMAAGQLPYALMSAPVAADASQPNAVRHVPSSNSTLPSCIGDGNAARNLPNAAGDSSQRCPTSAAPCSRSDTRVMAGLTGTLGNTDIR
jgi:hypothetical protein